MKPNLSIVGLITDILSGFRLILNNEFSVAWPHFCTFKIFCVMLKSWRYTVIETQTEPRRNKEQLGGAVKNGGHFGLLSKSSGKNVVLEPL